MVTVRILFLIYILVPIVSAVFPLYRVRFNKSFSSVLAVALFRIVMLTSILVLAAGKGSHLEINGTLVTGYPLNFLLLADEVRLCLLLAIDSCFLLVHWMCEERGKNAVVLEPLLFLTQALASLVVLSENVVTTGGLLALAAIVFFYLMRFSDTPQKEMVGALVAKSSYLLYFLIGIFLVAWGITEFGEKDLRFSGGSGSITGVITWMLIMVMAIPVSIWNSWLHSALEELPSGITLALVSFMSVAIYKLASVFGITYPDLAWKYRVFFYVLGILSCLFSVGKLFTARNRRSLLVSSLGFFFALVYVSLGVSQGHLMHSVYYICIFLPVFSALLLIVAEMKVETNMQKILMMGVLTLAFGLPGTPVFLIFSSIGARSIEMGANATLIFGLIWFVYILGNVFICRRLFLDRESLADVEHEMVLARSTIYLGYGLLLILFVVSITLYAGGLL